MYARISALRMGVLVGIVLFAARARAVPYEVFVDARDVEDVYSLFERGLIEASSLGSLIDLLERGVDLGSATRDELYELPNLTYSQVDGIIRYRDREGAFPSAAGLVDEGLLTARELGALSAFIVDSAPGEPFRIGGRARYGTVYLAGEQRVPAMRLQARLEPLEHFEVGVAGLLTRNRIGQLYWNLRLARLEAKPMAARLRLPKYYVRWSTPDVGVIAGTYTIGFGERLTFDNTSRTGPDGFAPDDRVDHSTDLIGACRESAGSPGDPTPCPTDPSGAGFTGLLANDRTTPDFHVNDRLEGLAAGVRNLPIGDATGQVFGFVSYARRAAYQYDLFDPSVCPDPRANTAACSPPPIFLPSGASSFDTIHKFQVVPGVFDELLAGGNASVSFDESTHLGLTAWGADLRSVPFGIELDLDESGRTPFRGPMGAIGVHGGIEVSWADLAFEVTRSFDAIGGRRVGGGFGAIARGTGSFGSRQAELSLRYYDARFANPYARPISSDDVVDGLSPRDEAGLRFEFAGPIGVNSTLRSSVDVWTGSSGGPLDARLYIRGDHQFGDALRLGGSTRFHDKALGKSGTCYVGFYIPGGITNSSCTGHKIEAALDLSYRPVPPLALTVRYEHAWQNDSNQRYSSPPIQPGSNSRLEGSLRQDLSASLLVDFEPAGPVGFRLVAMYRSDEWRASDYLQHWMWTYTAATLKLTEAFEIRVRYDLRVWLGTGGRTTLLRPNPEHWVWLELEGRL